MSVELTHYRTGHIRQVTAVVVAGADGSVPLITLPPFEGYLLALQTTPGAPGPTSGYKVALLDQSGLDVLEGHGIGRSASAHEQTLLNYPTNVDIHPVVDDSDVLVLRVTDNHVPFAQFTITIRYGIG